MAPSETIATGVETYRLIFTPLSPQLKALIAASLEQELQHSILAC